MSTIGRESEAHASPYCSSRIEFDGGTHHMSQASLRRNSTRRSLFSELPVKDISRASYPNSNSLELMHHITTEFSSKIFQFNPRDSMMDHTQSNLYHSCLTNYSTIQIEIAERRSCIKISTIQHHAYPFSHFSPSPCR